MPRGGSQRTRPGDPLTIPLGSLGNKFQRPLVSDRFRMESSHNGRETFQKSSPCPQQRSRVDSVARALVPATVACRIGDICESRRSGGEPRSVTLASSPQPRCIPMVALAMPAATGTCVLGHFPGAASIVAVTCRKLGKVAPTVAVACRSPGEVAPIVAAARRRFGDFAPIVAVARRRLGEVAATVAVGRQKLGRGATPIARVWMWLRRAAPWRPAGVAV